MSKVVIIQGAPLPPKPRLEIKQFIGNKKQFSLYVQALGEMYRALSADPVSFFQVGGIHGRPYVSWPGGGPRGGGYCVHETQQFLTWHRPYVVLLEQEIQKHAKLIAAKYTTDPDAWKTAADDLRQPYWNWADESGIFPDALRNILSQQKVTIGLAPDGHEQPVVNPFYWYPFKGGERDGFEGPPKPWKDWPATLRHPTTQGSNAVSDIASLKRTLESEQKAIINDTGRLFSIKTWKEFSLGGGTTNSLERIHDKMHVLIGRRVNGGHMSFVDYAGFDPIFYMHHAQVDRLTHMWHSQHRLWAPDGAALLPFSRTDKDLWKSQDIKMPEVFRYRYTTGAAKAVDEDVEVMTETSILEWTVRIRCKKFEVGGNFSVLLFLNDSEDPRDPQDPRFPGVPELPSDPNDWFFSPTFIGSFDAFVNDSPEECENCQEVSEDLIWAYVHINDSILESQYGGSLDPEVVEPLLTKRLNWRVLKADGSIVDLSSSFPSLVVEVIATPLSMVIGVPYPEAGEPVVYDGITRGKPRGSGLELS